MKHAFFILTSTLIALCSYSQTNSYLSQSDAIKILGQAAILTQDSVEKKGDAVRYWHTYTATKEESSTGKIGHLYFMFENYNNVLSAQKTYADIFSSNQNMPNLKKLNIGDEALRHTDHQNFDMIIVRKGNKIIRLKVNRLTSMTSSKDLLEVAEKITGLL